MTGNVRYETSIKLPESAKRAIQKMRDAGELHGKIVIEETGSLEITIECESNKDAVSLRLIF